MTNANLLLIFCRCTWNDNKRKVCCKFLASSTAATTKTNPQIHTTVTTKRKTTKKTIVCKILAYQYVRKKQNKVIILHWVWPNLSFIGNQKEKKKKSSLSTRTGEGKWPHSDLEMRNLRAGGTKLPAFALKRGTEFKSRHYSKQTAFYFYFCILAYYKKICFIRTLMDFFRFVQTAEQPALTPLCAIDNKVPSSSTSNLFDD